MADEAFDLSTLVSSRICHDVISPVGAIGNGLEFLQMTGNFEGEEMQLVQDSLATANARIRFLRLAFGRTRVGQTIAAREVAEVLTQLSHGGRLHHDWPFDGTLDRPALRAVLLAGMCMETALPRGGTIAFARPHGWTVTGTGPDVRQEPDFWTNLSRNVVSVDASPARVQFALLPGAAKAAGLVVSVRDIDSPDGAGLCITLAPG
ncbi:histidine phosphotransferase family protein [Mesobacterium sp. TK19101]|uniref:Histidine phosphotransferase family protein n=1 Tax=Mesobacterium hydrothermale TaxID=3111907 RepID=A0ABU6HER5_9RHOB|nr:histidine phosphotransferase family protein [Mesobacterium sp. TK19101]MEC3860481.1 histidine phosphotransferase family protein [Mesobacterium sp. TK19101]